MPDFYEERRRLFQQNKIVPNVGIDPILDSKEAFYIFCQQHPSLTRFIPKTYLPTLETLSSYEKELNTHRSILYKPIPGTRGEGIRLFQGTFSEYEAELKRHCLTNDLFDKLGSKDLLQIHPFVLQEYIDAPTPISVIRLYLTVTISPENEIMIDYGFSSAYQSNRKIEDPNDFTAKNNKNYTPCHFTALQQQFISTHLGQFITEFFATLLEHHPHPQDRNEIYYQYSYILLKKYLIHHSRMQDIKQQVQHLSCYLQALHLEQRNKELLSDDACYSLCKLFELISSKQDLQKQLSDQFLARFTLIMCKHLTNTTPSKCFKPIHVDMIFDYLNMLLSLYNTAKRQTWILILQQCITDLRLEKPIPELSYQAGVQHFKDDQFELARCHILYCIERFIDSTVPNKKNIASCYFTLGSCLDKLKRSQEALTAFDNALTYCTDLNLKERIQQAQKKLAVTECLDMGQEQQNVLN